MHATRFQPGDILLYPGNNIGEFPIQPEYFLIIREEKHHFYKDSFAFEAIRIGPPYSFVADYTDMWYYLKSCGGGAHVRVYRDGVELVQEKPVPRVIL